MQNTSQRSIPPEDAPGWVEDLIGQAESAGASDIHLQTVPDGAQVLLRLDGVMVPGPQLPANLAERVFGRIKFLACLKTYQESLPQEGRINRGEVGARQDIRVATYPTVTGEKIVLRLFHATAALSLRELELPEVITEELEKFLRGNSGLLLLTGPAGSGKSTTIYACLRFLAELGGRHIITIEDPVEQVIPGIMQTEVNEARGLTFAKAARHLLRQDPQVLALGEIRDEETANLAVRAALTGHMVLSTLHAGSCRGVFERLSLMCRDAYAVQGSVELVLNQRLVRRFCSSCQGAGCVQCFGTGYRGRLPLVEWIKMDETARAILKKPGGLLHPQWSLADAAREILAKKWSSRAELERCLGAGSLANTTN